MPDPTTMPSTEGESQVSLLPDAPPEKRYEEVPLDWIEAVSEPPDYVHSMQRDGLLQPVGVRESDDGGLMAIGYGRRRIASARKLGWETIPAYVYPPGTPLWLMARLALIENDQRGVNVVSDLRNIEALLATGAGEKEVAAALKMGLSTLRKRLKLLGLSEPLRQALDERKIAVSVAEAAATLESERQATLAAVLETAGKLTAHDVRAVRMVRQEEEIALLPDALFEVPEAAPAAPFDGVLAHLEGALAALPPEHPRAPDVERWLRALLAYTGRQQPPAPGEEVAA